MANSPRLPLQSCSDHLNRLKAVEATLTSLSPLLLCQTSLPPFSLGRHTELRAILHRCIYPTPFSCKIVSLPHAKNTLRDDCPHYAVNGKIHCELIYW